MKQLLSILGFIGAGFCLLVVGTTAFVNLPDIPYNGKLALMAVFAVPALLFAAVGGVACAKRYRWLSVGVTLVVGSGVCLLTALMFLWLANASPPGLREEFSTRIDKFNDWQCGLACNAGCLLGGILALRCHRSEDDASASEPSANL